MSLSLRVFRALTASRVASTARGPRRLGLFLASTSVAALSALAPGCTPGEVAEIKVAEVDCIPDQKFFEEKVWRGFMSSTCFACHNAQGAASATDLVLRSPNQPGAVRANFDIVANVAAYERDGLSILLQKPLGKLDHGGGAIYTEDDLEFRALTQLVKRYQEPTNCEVTVDGDFYSNVELLDNAAALRKASLMLTDALPDADSTTMVRDGDDADFDAAIDNLLEDEAFYDSLKEIYNDKFLTNRYDRNNDAINLLSDRFPNRYWFEELDETLVAPGYLELAQRQTNRAVAKEPLELVAYLARNNLPFTEIITADYIMVNPFSAKVYDVDVEFDDQNDPTEFRPGRIEGQPHAGVLSSAMWLNRFPTTETNRNRHRARMVFEFFLATDVMRLAERPVDPTSIVDFNPTLYNPDCAVCHANIDPVAGAFQNWDRDGDFNPREEGWYPDMRPPGFGESAIPSSSWGQSLPWLAQTITQDPLFDLAIAHTLFKGLTGEAPLTSPAEEDANLLKAYQSQAEELEAVAASFRASGHNIKVAVKELIKSKAFRAINVVDAEKDPTAFASLGTARFLTPELLDRKIVATTGVRWTRGYDGTPYLLNENEFLIFYGGINSNTVTQRITEPNGLMTSIAKRMANEVACAATARDFTRPMEERLLFNKVERTFEPEDANGFEVAGASSAIRENIVALHERLLGERLSVDDPEVDRTFTLFLETWREGKAALDADEVSDNVAYQCRATTDLVTGEDLPPEQQVNRDDTFTVRAWMAVMSYMLSDYRFLHE